MQKICVSPQGPIKTIKDALKQIDPMGNAEIVLSEGVYHEKIRLSLPHITLRGAGIGKTILFFEDSSQKIHPDGRDYNTFRTPTLLITGSDCKLMNLTIRNDGDPSKGQAVALAIYGNRFIAENIEIKSYHDTLFLGPLPDDLKERYFHFLSAEELFIEGSLISRFSHCKIEGDIDFIFGTGKALFYQCEIISNRPGFITAPGHSQFQNQGFLFYQCHFVNQTHLQNCVYLSRPWRPFGKVVFIDSQYDNHIKKEGIQEWHNVDPMRYSRFYEYPKVLGRVPYFKQMDSYTYEKYLRILQEYLDF